MTGDVTASVDPRVPGGSAALDRLGRAPAARSMWKTSRSSRETGLSSGFDGISSRMWRHQRRQTSVDATAAQRSSLSISA